MTFPDNNDDRPKIFKENDREFSSEEDFLVYKDVLTNSDSFLKTVSPRLYSKRFSEPELVQIFSSQPHIKQFVDKLLLDLSKGDKSLLDSFTEADKVYILEILRQMSDTGYSHLLKSIEEIDYVRKLVSPQEFLLSDDYIGKIGKNLYPSLREEFYKICSNDEVFEVILTGSIGWGKSFLSTLLMAWILYRLSCLRNPHSYYGLSENTPIVLMNFSVLASNANTVIFNEFKKLIDGTNYFNTHFKRNKKINDSLVFPNNVVFMSGGSRETGAIGQNLFSIIGDELNFMDKVRGSVRAIDASGTYDQAKQIYNSTVRRIKSRFMKAGKIPGKAIFISSKRRNVEL